MIKKLVILSVIVFIIGAIYLFFQKKQGINNTSGWPWKEYPRNFLNVDCNTVPTSAAARPGSDIMQNLRSICWQDRAWYENKWEFCNNLDDFWADHCLEWMAIKLKDNNMLVPSKEALGLQKFFTKNKVTPKIKELWVRE